MKEKEIIFLVGAIKGGGAERVAYELATAWNSAGHHVTVVVMTGDKGLGRYQYPDSIKIVDMQVPQENKIVRTLCHCIKFYKFLRNHKDAVVVAFNNIAIRTAGIVCTVTGNRLILSERCDPVCSPPRKVGRIVRDAIFYWARVDTFVFQTEDAMNYFPAKVRSKGVIIPNPINPALPDVWPGTRRKVVVTAGRLTPQKNLPMLVRAFARFSREHPDYTLEIYGSGAGERNGGDEPVLRSMISTLHMEDRIFLKGFSDCIYEKMRDATMYVSSSNYEGISNSMLEAMGLGVPTVATDCPAGGARMAIQNGENGILVPVSDEDALYLAMKKIAEDTSFAKRISENSCKIRERFKLEAIAKKWLDII